MGTTDRAKETAELIFFFFAFFLFNRKKFGRVARSAGLGRKAQSRGVLPALLAKATRAGHRN